MRALLDTFLQNILFLITQTDEQNLTGKTDYRSLLQTAIDDVEEILNQELFENESAKNVSFYFVA